MELDQIDPQLRRILQVALALVLGGVIGWEREMAGKWAGLRTHMLICVAGTLFVLIAQLLVEDWSRRFSVELLKADPIRILEAIVTGVAFIGAGTIFRDRENNVARGLTTAASLLAVAPIGIAVALGEFLFATGVTGLLFFILRVVAWVEVRAFSTKKATK